MAYTKHISVQGFILKKREYREADEIVTMFTRELGKVRIFAKGARKITSRRAPHIQTGNFVNCILSKRDDLYFLQETYLRSGLSSIKTYVGGVNFLYQYFFIVDRMVPELEPEEELYNTVCAFCKDLAFENRFSQADMQSYIERLLFILGYGDDEREQSDIIAFAEKVMQEKVPLHVII